MLDPYKHLEVLERRIEWLSKRIAIRSHEGKEISHDVAEIGALRWAVQTIYDWVELPKVEGLNKDET